jgi:hypothetical protein
VCKIECACARVRVRQCESVFNFNTYIGCHKDSHDVIV